MKTTLKKIRACGPCQGGWEKLLRHLGKTKADDEPLAIIQILASNGLNDAIWCLRAVDGCDREIRLFAVWCARRVRHLMIDPRSIAALDVAERFANGEATEQELAAAWDVARAAAWDAARAAARAAAGAAAGDAARAAQEAELRRLCGQWQGLTDDDIRAVRDSFGDEPVMLVAFARAIEAKLREKNA